MPHQDPTYVLETARTIVKGKIRNGRAAIARYAKNNPSESFDPALSQLDEILAKLERQASVNSIMGSEGIATAVYFKAYGHMFRKELRFEVRTKRPPKDPVNALLSLGYSLLTNEILSLVIASGMDPYLGFLHGTVYGRPSLALDLIEEFRHPLIDRFTLNLLNNELFGIEDFRPVEKEGVYLTPEAMKTYFRLYERRMTEPVSVPDEEEKSPARELLKRQVRRMAKAVSNGMIYQPHYSRW